MGELAEAQRRVLVALDAPGGRTIIGGFDIEAVFSLVRKGLLREIIDPLFPSFVSYKITTAGRAALVKEE